MQFKIIQKLFILILLPILTLVFFSVNNIAERYNNLNNYKIDLRNLELLKDIDTFIYFMQLEHLESLKFLNMPQKVQLLKKLQETRTYTDKALLKLQKSLISSEEKTYMNTANNYIKSLQPEFDYIDTMRTSIEVLKMEDYIVDGFYENINHKLLLILYNFQFQYLTIQGNIDLNIMKKVIQLQEYADKERVVVAKIISFSVPDTYDYELFNTLLVYQEDNHINIEFLLHKHPLKNTLLTFYEEYQSNVLDEIRDSLREYDFTKIDSSKRKVIILSEELYTWLNISTQRIDDLGIIKKTFIQDIEKSITASINKTQNDLNFLMLITFITILFLLMGAMYLSKSIKSSIDELEKGLDNFFKYLNFNSKKPDSILITTSDEIADISHKINEQMGTLEDTIEEDETFIDEITAIVSLMKEGNFTERVYFEPKNPNLKELKNVFNQLIELITDKIDEQTKSLESLNSSLEDKVNHQTLELEKQINVITLSMENVLKAEIAKDEFLATMSHEIRTPLNAILGFVTLLKKIIKEEKALSYLSIIDTSGKSLLTIINDILDFSKIKSGKFTIAPHPISVIDIMSDSSLLFASKAYEKHLQLAVYIDPNMPKTMNLDSVRVIQIFSNILSNAIKFTQEDGSIEVNVSCNDSLLKVSVKDSGIGIAPKNISKVFSAFEQADGSTTRKYGGTGLGLSISYNLAQLMNGDIVVESQEGIGSTFTLTLPVEVIDNSPGLCIIEEEIKKYTIAILDNNQKENKRGLIKKYLQDFEIKNIIHLSSFQKDGYDLLFFTPDDEYNEDIVYATTPAIALLRNSSIKLAKLPHIRSLSLPYTPKSIVQVIYESNITILKKEKLSLIEEDTQIEFIGKVLVAEDNKTNQMLISLLLEDYTLEFTLANNGVEAVEKFKKEKFDLVLMDENMPELNGIGAMQEIKAYEKENNLSHTPIIALTASVLQNDKEKFLDAGMDGFVGKPIENKILDSELARYLKQRS